MRQRGRVDRNQAEITRALRQIGATVLVTSNLGCGAPDLVVGFRGKNLLMEIKDGTAKPSDRRLTTDEKAFHFAWQGRICVVENVAEALFEVEN